AFVDDSDLTLSGVTELDPARQFPTRLTLRGDRVPVAQRPDATIYASPDLEAVVALPEIRVSGVVRVPEAAISVEELPAQAVRVSPDTVVHGETATESLRPLQIVADIRVELGENLRYTGGALRTDLSGDLNLSYESGLSPEASGVLRVDGTYEAYGQVLDLERGELLFTGNLADPALDVLAVRRIGATTVGIELSGTLTAPVSSVYSEPAMSEANALSYLLFSRPLSSSDDEETATLESTALALGLQQALPVVERLGDSLGLDELSIETTDVDAGALMAGKYLSPKLYMSYSYGLFNRLGGFLLRYSINDRFSLETRSGTEKSMDLLYTVEKE
ncbi:MAG: translocation/assembly module TamB domain-containing protein, partial [Gammaproteobacteria bacterium]|nr:translocation/assembly module TamB domain-containing protein [Gammaproteobacteria bacterium]